MPDCLFPSMTCGGMRQLVLPGTLLRMQNEDPHAISLTQGEPDFGFAGDTHMLSFSSCLPAEQLYVKIVIQKSIFNQKTFGC